MDDLLTLRIAFSFLRGMNVTLGRELLRLCGSEERFFAMSESELRNLTHSSAEVYSKDYRTKVLAKAEAEALFVRSHSVGTLYFTDEDYPQRLLDCDDAPVLIYSSGQTDLNHCQAIGIVGTRHATPYGADFTRRLVRELAQKLDNPVIISGLAYGIDIAAHRAALEAGIPTVAVMATAISSIYPAEHRASAVDIVRSSGMLLTEYSSRRVIHRANFLERNRIVAGMSDCLIVSESAEKGGALVTAQLAADYNRDVFAVPGRVNDRYSCGCNRIIASGMARLLTGADDIIAAMGWTAKRPKKETSQPALPIALNPDEELIVRFLETTDDASLAQLTAATGFPIARLMSMLIDMEFRGLLLSLPGAKYRLT